MNQPDFLANPKAADLLATVAAYKPQDEANVYPKYARVDEMRTMLEVPEMPAEALYGTAIIDFITAATDLRESATTARKEREAAAKEAAEAEEGE